MSAQINKAIDNNITVENHQVNLGKANIEILENVDHEVHQGATVCTRQEVVISTKLYLSLSLCK